jgi:hypothetical protein
VRHGAAAVDRQRRLVGVRPEAVGRSVEVVHGIPDLRDGIRDTCHVLVGVAVPRLSHEPRQPGVVVTDLGFRDGAKV